MRIADLVGLFSERYGKPVRTIGVRPGEKLHEVLISEAESVRTAFDGRYFRMKPAHQAAASGAKVFAHTSEDDLFSPAELSKYLQSKGVFQDDVEKFARDIDDIGDPVDQIIKQ
jgi:UDP-glucose 4-epimerase